jgi:hypothetical protein
MSGAEVTTDTHRAPPEFVTCGAIGWLPDIYRWAEIVCHFLTRRFTVPRRGTPSCNGVR